MIDQQENILEIPPLQSGNRMAGLREDGIPGYRIIGELGRGGMGVVYKAVDTRLKRTVALKLILSAAHSTAVERARFQTEAETCAQLQHPNIVQVYEAGEADGLPFLVMEYCPGGSLDDRIKDRTLSPREAAEIIATMAEALEVAHHRGIIHRDLKPANILYAADGTLKIADFGLAKHLDANDENTLTGIILGSLNFMAPEQASGRTKEATAATDVYALGALLYRILTGKPPFQGANEWETVDLILKGDATSVETLLPTVPRDLATICHKCLEKEPDRRYPTAGAMEADLRRFLADQPVGARPVSLWERTLRWARRNPGAVSVAVASLLMLCLVAFSLEWSATRSHRLIDEVSRTHTPLVELGGEIRYLDEVLTTSAYLNATTGDPKWEERYLAYEPKLTTALQRAEKLAPAAAAELKSVADANDALVAMEKNSFSQVRSGAKTEAWNLLNSDAYRTQKARYAAGLEAFITRLGEKQDSWIQNAERETGAMLIVGSIAAASVSLLLLFSGALVVRALRRD